MFPDAPPVRKMRRCLHCYRKFDSSSAAERVCPGCRRKHNKLLERYGGVVTFETTPQMAAHMQYVTETECLPTESINAFLDGGDVDDSAVYEEILSENRKRPSQKKNKIKRTVNKAAAQRKTEAVFLLESILEASDNVCEKKIKVFLW